MASLRMKDLEQYLQQLDIFEKPKVMLEQYPTSAHIASHLLYTAQSQFNDIENCSIADLGAGCGVLSLGAKMLNASYVVAFEIDPDAVDILKTNCDDIELFVDIVQCDILQTLPDKFEKMFDTVIMNPPFGTKKNAGIDIKFLEIATKLAKKTVYSLHKTSTRNYVLKKAQEFGFNGKVIAELRYDLPQVYKFHKKSSVDIQVDFIRFSFDN
ncbi:hypothetical protein HCN44_007435 [Aphidius gifuensis]|uniref:Methyltransferase-like protein 5 n=1 Tax=Aphidius gifuensis TaxID=684658 RepID=A0A834XPK8_APHGI|nr:rRNA N6-adenosine-methyltransferase METTL5 [Aphidius gifuensis]KAF7989125.1 hypothetical protein HCN44_007435 [Aphidius gifuensis]